MENSKEAAFGHGNPEQGGARGLTKREYFAGLAMKGILATTDSKPNYDIVAKWSIEQADELLKQLEA